MTNNNWYQPNPYQNNPNYNNHPQNRYSRISIEDAMSIATGYVPGEVVKVELETENGMLIYEVKVATAQGIRYEIEIDAQTGRILKVELD